MTRDDLKPRRICVVNEKEMSWEAPILFYPKDDVDALLDEHERTIRKLKKELQSYKNRYYESKYGNP